MATQLGLADRAAGSLLVAAGASAAVSAEVAAAGQLFSGPERQALAGILANGRMDGPGVNVPGEGRR